MTRPRRPFPGCRKCSGLLSGAAGDGARLGRRQPDSPNPGLPLLAAGKVRSERFECRRQGSPPKVHDRASLLEAGKGADESRLVCILPAGERTGVCGCNRAATRAFGEFGSRGAKSGQRIHGPSNWKTSREALRFTQAVCIWPKVNGHVLTLGNVFVCEVICVSREISYRGLGCG